jgi:bifunctional UDP-N-acetylglucosamine pyrophosphorylase / glucosamine-1-phosphate N-acetyltransferase
MVRTAGDIANHRLHLREPAMRQPRFAALVLAAGSGTRMRSARPKVMHPVAGRPMIAHLLAAIEPLRPAACVVVIGPRMDDVARFVAPVETAVQDPALGTGDAVRIGLDALEDRLAPNGEIDAVLVLCGDTPLLRSATLARLFDEYRRAPAAVLLGAMRPADPGPYGRLVAGPDGNIRRIVEAADAKRAERAIEFVWGGLMLIEAAHVRHLIGTLERNNAKREFYLTGVVAQAADSGLACRAIELPVAELVGVNTRVELAEAEAMMQVRLRRAAMEAGATLVAPQTVFLSADTRLGQDVTVEPNVVFGPGVVVGNGVHIRAFSHLEGAEIGANCSVGPFARLRPGTVLEGEVHLGNFVEVKAARLGRGAKVNHLSYLGDSEIGAGTNIGAGTITCNYDGVHKHRTVIGEGVFIGSNTALVAPVSVGRGAFVAAGSVVTRDIPADALTIARGRQVDKPGRAPEIRARLRRGD